jgi:hypothetical protein
MTEREVGESWRLYRAKPGNWRIGGLVRLLVQERARNLCHMWQKWDECDRQKHHIIEALRDFGIDPDEYNHG